MMALAATQKSPVSPEKVERCEIGAIDKNEAREVVHGEEEKHAEEVEMGSRKTKKMIDPKMPNGETVREHEMTHVPYRNWCRHCVRGRGKEMATESLGRMSQTALRYTWICAFREKKMDRRP